MENEQPELLRQQIKQKIKDILNEEPPEHIVNAYTIIGIVMGIEDADYLIQAVTHVRKEYNDFVTAVLRVIGAAYAGNLELKAENDELKKQIEQLKEQSHDNVKERL